MQFLPLRCFLLPLSKIVGEGRECIGIGFFFFSLTAAFSVVAVAYFLRFSRDDWLEFYIPDINSLSFFRTCLWVNFEFLREKFIILYLQGL